MNVDVDISTINLAAAKPPVTNDSKGSNAEIEAPMMATLRERLINRVKKFGVEDHLINGRHDGSSVLCYRGKSFAHFHGDNELDIRLTKAVISREGPTHPSGSIVHPNRSKSSPWIEVQFHTSADLNRVVRLVKLAVEQM